MKKTKSEKGNRCVIILGSYTNACSIVRSLLHIRYPYRIVVIETAVSDTKCMAEVLYPHRVEIIKGNLEDLADVVTLINTHVSDHCHKTILMTEEAYIEPVRQAIQNHILHNTVSYTGSGIDNDIIFDRYRFYQFIEKVGCFTVPKTISSDEDPQKHFGSNYIIRLKKSWEGNKKLPRLEIITNEAERMSVEQTFLESGLTRDMWCYQEVLSTLDTHNVSICGWYDKDFKQFAVTRKVLQHPPKTGNGDVVEIVHDFPESLISAAKALLKALDYSGAFELEFVFDTNSENYKLIELNPRFWMQHGLIEELTEYALIRRALGSKKLKEIPYQLLKHRFWINGNQALYRLAKGQVVIMHYMLHGSCYPHLYQSVKWAFYYQKYKKFLSEPKVLMKKGKNE